MKSIFLSVINGDLLKLAHLSNGFRMVEGAGPLQVGDVCRAEARIASVTNTDAGKVVKVKGHVYRKDKPVIRVVSSFFYRGRFTNFGISCPYIIALPLFAPKWPKSSPRCLPVSVSLLTLSISIRDNSASSSCCGRRCGRRGCLLRVSVSQRAFQARRRPQR